MRAPNKVTPLFLAAALAVTLAACGSGTPATVTVTRTVPASTTSSATAAPPTHSSSSSSSPSTSTGSTTSSTSSATATTSTTTSATSSTQTTRTQTGPAFVGTNPSSGTAIGHDLAAAIAVLTRHGYVPVGTASYGTDDTLRVLIGREPGTTNEHAFFFDQTIYLGTDASAPSGQITLVGHSDTEAVLAYGIYQPGASAPSSERRVHFALDMGQLSAIDPLPSVAERR